jgi:RNA polymerase sigma factor (sigma-70 family)
MQARLDQASDTNATILGAACAGDASAWDELVRRYHGAVRSAVGSYRLKPADTADAIQNTWLRLFERAATIRNPDMLGGWLTTTARRECLALIRRQRAERPLATIDSGQPAPDPTPEAAVIIAEAQRHVRSATDTLSDRQRTLIDAPPMCKPQCGCSAVACLQTSRYGCIYLGWICAEHTLRR